MATTCSFNNKGLEASTKAWLRTRNIITDKLVIKDLAKFRMATTALTKLATAKYGITERLFSEEQGGRKAVVNTDAFRRMDAIRGFFYPENEIYRNLQSIDKGHLVYEKVSYADLLDTSDIEQAEAEEIALQIAGLLNTKFNIKYTVISKSDAENILLNSAIPYTGEAGFYYGDTVYLVKGKFTKNTAIHEFAHPFIKAIQYENPDLFENLYQKVISEKVGRGIQDQIIGDYPELLETGREQALKEEVVVTMLEQIATKKVDAEVKSKGISEFLRNVLFAIKKILRALNPKANLQNLKLDTTFEQLADMMFDNKNYFKLPNVIQTEFANFKKDLNSLSEKLLNVEDTALQNMINKIFEEFNYELAALRDAPAFLKKELEGKDGIKIIKYVVDYIKPHQNKQVDPSKVTAEEVIDAIQDQAKDFNMRAIALISSMDKLEVFAEHIQKVLGDMESSKQYLSNIGISKVMFIKDLLERQTKFYSELQGISTLPYVDPLYKKVNTIVNKLNDTQKIINRLQDTFASEFFGTQSRKIASEIDNILKNRINKILKVSKVPQEVIDEKIKQIMENPTRSFNIASLGLTLSGAQQSAIMSAVKLYYAKRLNQKDIDSYLEGNRGDIGTIASYLTPYMSIDDPIISNFAKWLQIKMFDVEKISLQQANKIGSKIDPLLKDWGYNPTNTKALAEAMTFRDKIFTIDNETGEGKEVEVMTYLNEWKDYRAVKGRLQHEFDMARESKDKVKVKEAYKAIVQFNRDYMYSKFKEEYYAAQDIWQSDNRIQDPMNPGKFIDIPASVSFDAYLERQSKLNDLNTLKNAHFTELEDVQEFTQEDAARAEYNQLFDLNYPDGNPKTGEDLQKTLVRRKYRMTSKKFYESNPDIERLQEDLNRYVDSLIAEGITADQSPELYQNALDKFIKKNMKVSFSNKYFRKRSEAIDTIRTITAKRDINPLVIKRAKLYEERNSIKNLGIDKDGQPNGFEYSKKQLERLKTIEEDIVKVDKEFDFKSGLPTEDINRYYQYEEKLANNVSLTKEEEKDYFELINRKNELGLSKVELETLRNAFRTLRELSNVEPTSYYIIAFNTLLGTTENIEELTLDNADDWINNEELLNNAFNESADFEQWFMRNHYQKEVWENKVQVTKWFRTEAWSVKKPSDEKYIKHTTLINPSTKEEFTVPGLPVGKYFNTRIKDEFLTIPRNSDRSKLVGTIIDNQGNFLPRPYTPGKVGGAKDDKFVNKEYQKVKQENGPTFKLLEALKEEYLDIQKVTTQTSKLYLDLPRFRIASNKEYLDAGKFSDKVKAIKGEISETMGFKKTADASEGLFNFDPDARFVTTDLEGNPISRIPVRGLYNLPVEEVSSEILLSTYRYMFSINEQKVLRENESTAKSILNVLKDPKNHIKNKEFASKQVAKSTGKIALIPNGSSNKRAQAIEYLIDKTFYGRSNDDITEEYPGLTKVVNNMMRAASRSFIALDITSGLKNRFGMQFQAIIETAGGTYINAQSLAKGKVKAYETVVKLSGKDIYKTGPKSLEVQMMEFFNPVTGKTKTDFGKSASRSFVKDMFDMTWLYDFRRLADLQASLEVFWGMMYKKQINQIQADGSSKLIPYAEAFELDSNGHLKLKDGIDSRYANYKVEHVYQKGDTLETLSKKYNIPVEELNINLSGLEFGDTIEISDSELYNDFKLKIHGIGMKLNGAVDEFNSPQANKFLVFRFMTFYKKFATGMFLNRFQADMSKDNRWGAVYDAQMDTLTKGYYISAFQALTEIIKHPKGAWELLETEDKKALLKVAVEGMQLAILSMLAVFLFGYDKGDEDRFAKMEQREEDYGPLGWMANHMLYQLIMVKTENEAFVPILGFDEWLSYTESTSIATGPTLNVYVKIMNDLGNMIIGSEKAVYKADVGPYSWQKEGQYKLFNHLGALYGLKGKNYSAIHAIKSAETFANLK